MSSRRPRGPLLAVFLLGISIATMRTCDAQEFLDFGDSPAHAAAPVQLLRTQLRQAAQPLQPLAQTLQAIIGLIQSRENLNRQTGASPTFQEKQQMQMMIDARIQNLLQGPEMTSGIALAKEYRAVIERSLGNIDAYCAKNVNRDAMLEIPLSQRQRYLYAWQVLWTEDSAWVGMMLDAFRTIAGQYRAAPPPWLLDSLAKIQDRRISELERIARFLEYSRRMQEEYEGGFAEQERRLQPRISIDIAGKLIELYKNDGLMPYQSPRDCYELYAYLESLAALAKLYLKIGNYTGALQALRMSHLTDARDAFNQGNLRLLIEIDRLLQLGLRESQTKIASIKTREARENANWLMRKIPPNRTPQEDEESAWRPEAEAYLARLPGVAYPENSILVLIDTLADLHHRAGRYKTEESLLMKVIDSGAQQGQRDAGQMSQARSHDLQRRANLFRAHATIKMARVSQAMGQFDKAEQWFQRARGRLPAMRADPSEGLPRPANPTRSGAAPDPTIGIRVRPDTAAMEASRTSSGTSKVRQDAAAQIKAASNPPPADPFLLLLNTELCEDTNLGRVLDLELASFRADQSRYGEAERIYKKCLDERRKLLGQNHPDVAGVVRRLAGLYALTGRLVEAETLYRSSVRAFESERGPRHIETAAIVSDLGALYVKMGRLNSARFCLDHALRVYTSQGNLDPTHPELLTCLGQLADLYIKDSRAMPGDNFIKRISGVVALRRRVAGGQIDPLEEAACMRTVGKLLAAQKHYRRAEPYLQGALKLRSGHDHVNPLDVAVSAQELAENELATGDLAAARTHIEQSVKLREQGSGAEDSSLSDAYVLSARIAEASGQWPQAFDATDRARRAARRLLERYLPTLDEAAQLAYMKEVDQPRIHAALAQGLQHLDVQGISDLCAAWTINGKAVTLDALAQQHLLTRAPGDAESRLLSQELREVYNAQANLTYGWAPGRGEQTNQRLNRLAERERELVRRIGQLSRQGGEGREGSWVELAAVRTALPRDSALIELVRLEPSHTGRTPNRLHERPASYAAVIVPGRADATVRIIDLGPADVIDAAVTAARKAIQPDRERKVFLALGEREAERLVRVPLRKLAGLILDPIYSHLAGAQRWYLSPDAALWLVPWVALPLDDGTYVIERHEVHYLVSGRDLVRPREPVASGPSLVMADPDYSFRPSVKPPPSVRKKGGRRGVAVPAPDAARSATARPAASPEIALAQPGKGAAGARVGRTASRKTSPDTIIRRVPGEPAAQPPTPAEWQAGIESEIRAVTRGPVQRLSSTAREAEAIIPMLRRYTGQDPLVRCGQDAQEGAFKSIQNPRVVVLSTHGFAFGSDAKVSQKIRLSNNPLLRCGMILAGYNAGLKRKFTSIAQDDGTLTGLEILATDLRGTELVVLSACETGVGLVRSGEGVASLRQAFQLAGARAVVASLWQVPDAESAQLIPRFIANLVAGESQAEALRKAQLAEIASRRKLFRGAHPYFWAAFTVTGVPVLDR